LGNDNIEEPSALFTAARDDGDIVRRHTYQGNKTDVLGKLSVSLPITFKGFFVAAFHTNSNFVAGIILAIKHEEILFMHYHLRIYVGKHRMAEGKEIEGVEKVCLSLAVISYKAVELVGKDKFSRFYVSIIQY
jgi:hypothetical protein